jgi:voltage-gated potassium channel
VKNRIASSLDGGRFQALIQAAIALSCIAFTLETMPELSPYQAHFEVADRVFTIIFIVELLVRIVVVPKPLAYLTSFFGVVDLLAVLPGLVGINSKALRAVRLIRLLKLLRDERANRAMARLHGALTDVKNELFVFGFIAFLVLYLAAVGIYFCEHEAQPKVFNSIPTAMWWALATLTTVGYGDAYPVTGLGKIFAGVVILLGVGIVAIPTGLFASALTKNRAQGADE